MLLALQIWSMKGIYENNPIFIYDYTNSGSGNKLWGVSDAGTAAQSSTYLYDANGNAESDGQGNANTYNLFNMPRLVASAKLSPFDDENLPF